MSMSSLKSVMASAGDAVAIAKSDTTEHKGTGALKGLFIGTAGDVTVTMYGDTDGDGATAGALVTYKNVANGTILPVRPLKIMAATTAADIIGLKQ